MKTCAREGCDNQFEPVNSVQKYCCASCRQWVGNRSSPERVAAIRANAIRWRKNNRDRWTEYHREWERKDRARKRLAR